VNVLKQPEAPDAYYRIGPMEPMHRLTATVTIHEPEASRLFSGRTIAAEDETGALRIVRGVQWTDNATEMMQGALLDSLSGEGQFRRARIEHVGADAVRSAVAPVGVHPLWRDGSLPA
jgi:cholesterol transport system auxiliary component